MTDEVVTEPVAPVESAENFDSMFPEPSIKISGPPSWIWWAVLVGASVILGVAGITIARQNISSWLGSSPTPTTVPTIATTSTPVATATPVPTAAPTSTPTATASTVVKKSVTLRVLNGTTVTGAAGTVSNILEKAGFTVRTSGNAKNQTYTTSYVYYQKGKEAEAQEVAKSLTNYSPVIEESTLAAPDNILVVVGKK